MEATGWAGDNLVVRINWRDIRPVLSHHHLPPSAHTTFVGPEFVVATFTPRPLESDPDALNVPFFHNNDDYDELIFFSPRQLFQPRQYPPGHANTTSQGFYPRLPPKGLHSW